MIRIHRLDLLTGELIISYNLYIRIYCPHKLIQVARYHSLAAADENFPECLEVTARTEDGEIMAVKHRDYEVYGVQFHPESILTPKGKIMLRNFLEI